MSKGTYYMSKVSDKDYYLTLANRPKPKNAFSKFRGVSKNSNSNKPYRAALKHKGRSYYLGAFATELEAALAYNKAALAIVGDYAVLNELPNQNPETESDAATASGHMSEL